MLNLFQDEYIKKIEQILKEVYKFYKNSSKRKKALNATTSRQEKSLTALIDTMISEVKQGKEDLKQTTSLQLKKWNATRWLGRETCLKAICKAYEHLLEHLHEVSNMKSETASVKQTSRDLYNKLTSFDVFLFIFLYRDFASTLGTYSRYMQDRNLGIRDVGRRITSLSLKLRSNYPRDSLLPMELIGDGTADAILLKLFGNDMARLLEMEAGYSLLKGQWKYLSVPGWKSIDQLVNVMCLPAMLLFCHEEREKSESARIIWRQSLFKINRRRNLR